MRACIFSVIPMQFPFLCAVVSTSCVDLKDSTSTATRLVVSVQYESMVVQLTVGPVVSVNLDYLLLEHLFNGK